jgi:aquaporin Z
MVGANIGTQVVAASVAGAVLYAIAAGRAGFDPVESGFASNGYGDRSPGEYGLLAALIAEVVLTAIFLYIILGRPTTAHPRASPRSPSAWAWA